MCESNGRFAWVSLTFYGTKRVATNASLPEANCETRNLTVVGDSLQPLGARRPLGPLRVNVNVGSDEICGAARQRQTFSVSQEIVSISPNRWLPPRPGPMGQSEGFVSAINSSRTYPTKLSASGFHGSVSTASRPRPSRFRRTRSPAFAWAMLRAMLNPRPVPPVSRLREASSR